MKFIRTREEFKKVIESEVLFEPFRPEIETSIGKLKVNKITDTKYLISNDEYSAFIDSESSGITFEEVLLG